MLPPSYINSLPDSLVELYAQAEADILKDMSRRIVTYDYWIPAAEHQARKLEEMGMARKEIVKRLSATTGLSQKQLKSLMKEAGVKTITPEDETYKAAGMNPPPLAASAALQKTLNAGLKRTNGTFKNLTRTTANTATKQFEDALDLAWLQITSGAFDYNTAVRTAIKDLSRNGVGAIRYPSGHVDNLEVAVRRATITGVNQTMGKLVESRREEMSCNLVEVSAHAGARPDHAAWQGGIYWTIEKDPQYPLNFYDTCGYGRGDGIYGWNCSHSHRGYIKGMPRTYDNELLKEYEGKNYEYNGKQMTEYEANQQQRAIERQIRRWKRENLAMNAAGLDTAESAAKIAKWQDMQKDFLKQTGLKRQNTREQIGGNPSGLTHRHYQKDAKSDIITTRNKYKAGTHPVTQKQIDEIVSSDLKGISFSVAPTYNPRIRTPGKTTFLMYSWGEVKGVGAMQIGKQVTGDKSELLDTLLHEELEARIFLRPTKTHRKLTQIGTDEVIHPYIDKVIARYRRMKGV